MQVAKTWYESQGFENKITRILETHVNPDLRCNIWHIQGRDRDLMVDSGLGLRPLRQEVALLRERPVIALASHCHFDHVGAHHEFDERWIHASEAQALHKPDAHNTVWDNCGEELLQLSALPFADFSSAQYKVLPAPPTRLIEQGDEIDLGDRLLQVFHLPGHSPGSVCIYEAKSRTLFTGDVIYDGELYDFLYHSNIEIYLESMARLKEIPADVFHCGHFGSFGRERLHQLIDVYVEAKRRGPS